MRCEIVAVGTELLLGQTVDTNGSWMGEQLALTGIDCTHRQTVGDNLDRIVHMFSGRGRRMPANNLRQALVPEGATAIADPQPGTAPGLICPVGDKVIYALPGVPYEMQAITLGAVI